MQTIKELKQYTFPALWKNSLAKFSQISLSKRPHRLTPLEVTRYKLPFSTMYFFTMVSPYLVSSTKSYSRTTR